MIGVIILSIKGGKRGKISSAILVIAIILADYSSAQILKPFFQRLRPSHELIDGIRLLVPKGGKYGFVSSHAANIFAAATVLSYFYIKYKKLFFTIAVLVAFSRVYVGVHYPADVFIGGIIGYGMAWIFLTLWVILKMRELKRGQTWVWYEGDTPENLV